MSNRVQIRASVEDARVAVEASAEFLEEFPEVVVAELTRRLTRIIYLHQYDNPVMRDDDGE